MNEPTKAEATCEVPELAKVAGVEECTAVIDGVRWRYLHAGSGPALLLVHGFMGYSFSWRFVIAGLARHYSVYAVDLPGCGFSERSAALAGNAGQRCRRPAEFHGPHGHRAVLMCSAPRAEAARRSRWPACWRSVACCIASAGWCCRRRSTRGRRLGLLRIRLLAHPSGTNLRGASGAHACPSS